MQRAAVSVVGLLWLALSPGLLSVCHRTHPHPHSHGAAHLGNRRTVDVLRSYGYNAEEFSVVTEDGYILSLTHIRSAATKLPVLFMHGVIAASDQWIQRGPGKDLALILADEGHDVWLGDQRGNTFSRKHAFYNTSQPQYWDFSFHESGLYDLPALIETVLHHTGSRKLNYVGHSMGTTVFLVLCSLRPAYNQKINIAVLLSPVAFGTGKPPSPSLELLLNNKMTLADTFRKSKIYDFMSRSKVNERVINETCSDQNRKVCLNVISQLYGPGSESASTPELRKYLKSLQSGTSVKTMLHLAQLFQTKIFAEYDYGSTKNLEIYGRKTPPQYPIERVQCSVAIYYSDSDSFVDDQSVDQLLRRIPHVVTTFSVPNWNHIDVLFAKDAPTLLYKKIVKLLNKRWIILHK